MINILINTFKRLFIVGDRMSTRKIIKEIKEESTVGLLITMVFIGFIGLLIALF